MRHALQEGTGAGQKDRALYSIHPATSLRIRRDSTCVCLADAAALFQGIVGHLVDLGKRLFYGLLTLFQLAPKFAPRAVDIRLLHHLPQWDSNFRDRLIGLHTLEGILHDRLVGAVGREAPPA